MHSSLSPLRDMSSNYFLAEDHETDIFRKFQSWGKTANIMAQAEESEFLN